MVTRKPGELCFWANAVLNVIELKKKIAGTKPLDGRSEPYILGDRNN